MKVFAVLVNCFDEKHGRSTIKRYIVIEFINISAELLSGKILNGFTVDDIHLENLISDLSDSGSYMCGEKTGI